MFYLIIPQDISAGIFIKQDIGERVNSAGEISIRKSKFPSVILTDQPTGEGITPIQQ